MWTCVGVSTGTHGCQKRMPGYSGAGEADGCGLSDMGALCKNSTHP